MVGKQSKGNVMREIMRQMHTSIKQEYKARAHEAKQARNLVA